MITSLLVVHIKYFLVKAKIARTKLEKKHDDDSLIELALLAEAAEYDTSLAISARLLDTLGETKAKRDAAERELEQALLACQ
jgi:hypothetical protein